MSLRTRLILFALVPLLVVTAIFSAVTLHQGKILAERELQIFEQNLRRSKETALKDYVSIMRTAIDFIRQSSSSEDEARGNVVALMQEAFFSEDGYFYAYTYDGLNLVHAAQPALVGQDMIDFQDSNGDSLIRDLIRIAEDGGGYHQYLWQQPSTGNEVDKVGYVEQISDWQWMFGTGLYIDDIAAEMRLIEAGVDANVRQTLLAILVALMISIGVVVFAAVVFNVREHRLADQNLKELSHKTVQHQEEERRRVSRELHDGINQVLVSVKYRLETALTHIPIADTIAHESLVKGTEGLNRAIQEVRRISHDLRPSVLDDLGLLSAVKQLLDDFRERSGIEMDVDIQAITSDISEEVATTIYRIIQEALSNVEKHAQAKRLVLGLEEDAEGLFLSIADNGVGIAEKGAYANRGIGLRNMRERVEFLGGDFRVSSRPGNGTRIIASFNRFQA